jgi:hypothetical protein
MSSMHHPRGYNLSSVAVQQKIVSTCYFRRFTIARPRTLNTSQSDSPGNPVENPAKFDRFILLRHAWISAFAGMTKKEPKFRCSVRVIPQRCSQHSLQP